MYDPAKWAERLRELIPHKEEMIQVTREAVKYFSRRELNNLYALFADMTEELDRANGSRRTELK